MAVLPILVAPHPILALKCRPVRDDEFGPALAQILSDMAETMYAAPGVGLAAPQIGDPRRFIVIDSQSGEERGKHLYRMVNPEIVERGPQKINWNETCLSVPDIEVDVERDKRVLVRWREADGAKREHWFEEYDAVIVQHELDHLAGNVLLDKVSSFRRSRYLKKVKSRTLVAMDR